MSQQKTIIKILVGVLLSLAACFAVVEIYAAGFANPNALSFAALIIALILSVLSISYSIYITIKYSFTLKQKKTRLIVILSAYVAMIFTFAGIYYVFCTVSDLNRALSEYVDYDRHVYKRTIEDSLRYFQFPKEKPAFVGMPDKLWKGPRTIWEEKNILFGSEMFHFYYTNPIKQPIEELCLFNEHARISVFTQCLHISVLSMLSLSYTNCYPKRWYALLMTDVQAILSIVLLVVAFSLALSDHNLKTNRRDRKKTNNHRNVIKNKEIH